MAEAKLSCGGLIVSLSSARKYLKEHLADCKARDCHNLAIMMNKWKEEEPVSFLQEALAMAKEEDVAIGLLNNRFTDLNALKKLLEGVEGLQLFYGTGYMGNLLADYQELRQYIRR